MRIDSPGSSDKGEVRDKRLDCDGRSLMIGRVWCQWSRRPKGKGNPRPVTRRDQKSKRDVAIENQSPQSSDEYSCHPDQEGDFLEEVMREEQKSSVGTVVTTDASSSEHLEPSHLTLDAYLAILWR